jgi:hypothetical protein
MIVLDRSQSWMNVGRSCTGVSLSCVSKFPYLLHECLRLFALRRVGP